MDNRPTGRRVAHVILANRPARIVRETMFVNPQVIRAGDLLVDESILWIPPRDPAFPLRRPPGIFSLYSISAPSLTSIGAGVTT